MIRSIHDDARHRAIRNAIRDELVAQGFTLTPNPDPRVGIVEINRSKRELDLDDIANRIIEAEEKLTPMSKHPTLDLEEYLGEQAGRDAYDRGERWSIAKPEEWRRGWIAQQHKKAPVKFANERRDLKAFEQAAREMREKEQ